MASTVTSQQCIHFIRGSYVMWETIGRFNYCIKVWLYFLCFPTPRPILCDMEGTLGFISWIHKSISNVSRRQVGHRSQKNQLPQKKQFPPSWRRNWFWASGLLVSGLVHLTFTLAGIRRSFTLSNIKLHLFDFVLNDRKWMRNCASYPDLNVSIKIKKD